ncbi:MAG: protease inhibitor I42 family protein [Acidimicrobiales bacterium]
MVRRFPLLMAIGLLAACGGGSTPLVLTDGDSGDEVAVQSGERFEVRLESNPSTGFEWVVDEVSASDVIEVVSVAVEAAETELVGAPATQVFVLEAVGTGAGVLRFEYIRRFEDPVIPERIVEYIVRVDGAPFPGATDQPPPTSTATADGD